MKNIWKEYAGDFNSMTDEEIEFELRLSENYVDEHQSWIDAVASWKAAGKPRSKIMDLNDV